MSEMPVDIHTLNQCVSQASKAHDNIHPVVIKSIIAVEGGQIGTYSRNSNGTFDMGIMQINTIHLPDIAKKFGYSARDLVMNPCKSIMAGTWILWQRMQETKHVWLAVGNYHSKTPKHRHTYLKKVEKAYAGIVPVYGTAAEAKALGRTTNWGRSTSPQQGAFPSIASLEAMVANGQTSLSQVMPGAPAASLAPIRRQPEPRILTINNKRTVLRFID